MSNRSQILEARSGEGLIRFDLLNDEYSCLYNPDNQIRTYFSDTETQLAAGARDVAPLASSNWVGLEYHDRARLTVTIVFRFIISLAKALIRFHGKSVYDLVVLAERFQGGHSKARHNVEQLSCLFNRLLAYLPIQPECLFRSFFLLHFLDRHGLRADWLFGVQLFPFRAHCWAAQGNVLLNEVPHGIEDYQIIYRSGQAAR